MIDTDKLVAMYEARLHAAWEHGKLMQLKYATELMQLKYATELMQLKYATEAPFFYDIPQLEFQRSIMIDEIMREVGIMLMREEITQDEYWEIEDRL